MYLRFASFTERKKCPAIFNKCQVIEAGLCVREEEGISNQREGRSGRSKTERQSCTHTHTYLQKKGGGGERGKIILDFDCGFGALAAGGKKVNGATQIPWCDGPLLFEGREAENARAV